MLAPDARERFAYELMARWIGFPECLVRESDR
jgi:hypothetical protein